MIHIPVLESPTHGRTQARHESEIEYMARDYIADTRVASMQMVYELGLIRMPGVS
jgi:hypothetical protein